MPIMPDELKLFAKKLLIAGGFKQAHADDTANILIWADLRGTHSHGVLRIPRYVEMVKIGLINVDAEIENIQTKGSIAMLDADRMPGATAMIACMDRAVALAGQSALGLCSVQNITHAGAIGYFSLRAIKSGCIGIVMSASGPLMAYHGAKISGVSTNPLAIAVPDHPHPMLLDMSTSTVALGKIMQAKNSGATVPEGWGLDQLGNSTIKPEDIKTLTPLGGPKGSGLSLMIEILTSVLANNPVIAPMLAGSAPRMNGLALAINVSDFTDISLFASHIRELSSSIKGLPPADNVNEILLPGERGFRHAQSSIKNGITLAKGTIGNLAALARQLGVDVPREFSS